MHRLRTTNRVLRPNPKQAVELYGTHRDAIVAVVEAWGTVGGTRYMNAPVATALVEYVARNATRGLMFLREYATDNTSDVNASMLQKRVLELRNTGTNGSATLFRYRVAIAACRNHEDGTVPKLLRPMTWRSERRAAAAVA
jgi:hypothetical protein